MGMGLLIAVVFNTLAKQPQPERLPWTHRVLAPVDLLFQAPALLSPHWETPRDFLFRGDNADSASGVKGTFLFLIPSQLVLSWVTSRGHRPFRFVNYFQTQLSVWTRLLLLPNEDRRW